jgi:hypothetical protein
MDRLDAIRVFVRVVESRSVVIVDRAGSIDGIAGGASLGMPLSVCVPEHAANKMTMAARPNRLPTKGSATAAPCSITETPRLEQAQSPVGETPSVLLGGGHVTISPVYASECGAMARSPTEAPLNSLITVRRPAVEPRRVSRRCCGASTRRRR